MGRALNSIAPQTPIGRLLWVTTVDLRISNQRNFQTWNTGVDIDPWAYSLSLIDSSLIGFVDSMPTSSNHFIVDAVRMAANDRNASMNFTVNITYRFWFADRLPQATTYSAESFIVRYGVPPVAQPILDWLTGQARIDARSYASNNSGRWANAAAQQIRDGN